MLKRHRHTLAIRYSAAHDPRSRPQAWPIPIKCFLRVYQVLRMAARWPQNAVHFSGPKRSGSPGHFSLPFVWLCWETSIHITALLPRREGVTERLKHYPNLQTIVANARFMVKVLRLARACAQAQSKLFAIRQKRTESCT